MYSVIFSAILSLVLSCHFAHTNAQLRVLNGDVIEIEQTPHTVAIFEDKKYICVGALVKMDTVVTAAQCVAQANEDALIVLAGVSDISPGLIPGIGQQIKVKEIHECNYDRTTAFMDIAVVKVESEFSRTAQVKSISLCQQSLNEGSTLQISGWGSTKPNSNTPSNLLKTSELRIMDKKKCKSTVRTHAPYFADTIMCAGVTGKNPYHGDAGAAGLVGGQLCGVVHGGCVNTLYPAIFTDVTHPIVATFLKSKISSN